MILDYFFEIFYGGFGINLFMRGYGFGLGFLVVKDLVVIGVMGLEGIYGWGGVVGIYFGIDLKEDLIYFMMI